MKKILISSDPRGRFDLLLPKVAELHNKNKFDFMLVVGNVCPSVSASVFQQLKSEGTSFPLLTYFIDSSEMGLVLSVLHPEGVEMLGNFNYLGNIGYKQIQGIKIAFLSGKTKNNLISKPKTYCFPKQQARKLIQQLSEQQIDILLTNQWAEQYTTLTDTQPSKNQTISQVCYQLSPRYHIAASGVKYLRLPAFKGRKGNPTHFINVAQIGETLPKDKYLVAIQINAGASEVVDNLAENPLIKNSVDWNVVSEGNTVSAPVVALKPTQPRQKQERVLDKNSFILFEGFPEQASNSEIGEFLEKWGEIAEIEVFKKLKGNKKSGIVRFKNLAQAEICLKDSGKYSLYQSRIKFDIRQQNQKYQLKDCFLCIKNSKFDHNLLAYRSKFCFLCVDKGPVVDSHFQIVPLNHVSSTGELQLQQQQEITKIKSICQDYFIGQGFTFVCLERYMNLSSEINHAIIHCLPIKMAEHEVLQRFNRINYEGRHGFEEVTVSKNRNNTPYYLIFQINSRKFVKFIDRKDKKFEQGRQIVCEIIEKPEKLNWRDCELSQSQAQKIAQSISRIFQ